MEKQLHTWNFMLQNLLNRIPVMLLYVLESKGSSPGRQGFFMAVNASGNMQGSVGGGIMEFKFVEMAKEKLADDKPVLSVRKQVHDKTAAKNRSGMICSGEQTVFLYRLPHDAVATVQHIITCLQQHTNGSLQLSPGGLLFSDLEAENDYAFDYRSEGDWLYKEKLGYKNRLHIIGAGHCAHALSRIMSLTDFYICLYDDRAGLNTFTGNAYAHEKKLLNDYTELKELIQSGNHFVIVMTIGYRTDDLVIRTLIDKKFTYFGVLGSKAKLEKMFADYRKEGFSEAALENMHAPAGVPVNSRTPEEIAISIAAQIIAVKNKT